MLIHHGQTLFTKSELMCPDTREVRLHPGFSDHLSNLRVEFARPMTVNSCCRAKRYNKSIGGHARSLHVYDDPYWPVDGAMAIDIHMTDAYQRGRLMYLAWYRGWSIGVYPQFLHLDRRKDIGIRQVVFVG